MSSSDIIAKIKSGLSKAVIATGSSTSELIYLLSKETNSGNSPLNPQPFVESPVLLVNAIIKSYTSEQIDNENVRAGDKLLVSDADVPVKEGDVIRQGATDFTVVAVEEKAPTSDVLLYLSQIREK